MGNPTHFMTAVLMLSLILGAGLPAGVFGGNPADVGRWTDPFPIAGTNWELPTAENPMHAVMLPDGTVLIWRFGFYPVRFNPHSWEFTRIPPPPGVSRRLIGCTSHVLLPNGRVLLAGGTTSTAHGTHTGHAHVFLFDPDIAPEKRSPWIQGPDMPGQGRWYPTASLLSDGRVLVTAGNTGERRPNPEAVIYSWITNRWTTIRHPFTGTVPTYPHFYNVAGDRLLYVGLARRPLFLYDYNHDAFQSIPDRLTGGRHGGSSALFADEEGRRFVMVVGGGSEESPFRSVEYYPLSAQPGAWKLGPPMHHRRYHPNAVTLPNGQILVVGGDSYHSHETGIERPVLVPELFDPAHSRQGWKELAPHRIPRGAHNIAMLLPDARVLVLGGDNPEHLPRDSGKFFEIFSPPYLFRGARPLILKAPQSVTYQQPFDVDLLPSGGCLNPRAVIRRAVLIPLPSVTHSYTFTKGYHVLKILQQHHCLLLSNAPSFPSPTNSLSPLLPPQTWEAFGIRMTLALEDSPSLAPPGYYMLFLLNAQGVPSVAPIVRVRPSE